MADATKVVSAVDKTYADIQSVKTRMTGVTGTLNQLKVAVATALPADATKGQQINVGFVRQELTKAKEAVAKFKEMVREAAENGGAAGGGLPNARRQMKDDKTRTLYERVGGDLNIETGVEIMFNKMLQDSRVRSYFEKNQRKMQQMRKKFFQFISGFFGGPALYDANNIKPAHYHMNITDYHFDALLDVFQASLLELGVHPDATKDAIAACGKIRKDVTTGCTVRMELAAKNMEKGKDGLFKRMGGEEGIAQFMDRVYDLIQVDNRIKSWFSGKNYQAIKEGQRVYLTELLGGPKIYKGKDLVEIHKGMGLSDYEFDCFLANCEKAMSGLGVEDETIDEAIVSMEPVRAALMNRAQGLAAHAKMVDGQSIIERFGGEMNVESVVEMMYSGCLGDPRVRFYFEVNKEKIQGIKLKMTQLMVGAFGGATTYDDSKMRQIHYNMNITDYHFDAVLENFWCAAELMEISNAVISDAVEVLGKVRQMVTAGCTVRLEIARKKCESQGTDGLYESLGGQQGLQTFVDKLYETMAVDDRMKHYFSGSKLEAIKKSQGDYLAVMFGAPITYEGRPLDRIHSVMSISDFEFDAFLSCCGTALRAVGADSQNVDECVVLLETARRDVLINRRPHDVKRTQEAASAKSVYERIGGEVGVTNMVETMYNQALEDSRIRSFFEKNKAKVTTIKKKMTQYIGGVFGGPVTYDANDLRPMHYGMNISDYHFDAILDIIRGVLKESGSKPKDITDALLLLQPVRADVTTGFTVRQEMARKNVEKGKDQMFKRLGGSEGITALMDQLFNIATTDVRIKDFLLKDKDRIKAGMTVYFVEILGGPKAYKGKELGEIHKTLGVNDYHFDAFMGDFGRALLGTGHQDALIDEVMVSLEPVRCDVLGRSRDISDVSVMKDGKPLIERYGGDMNLETVVESMYDKLVEDPRVRYHFEKAKAKQRQIRRKMYQYLSGAFGGPVQYDVKQMRPAHYNMNITDYHFDVVSELFQRASKENGVEAEAMMDAAVVVAKVRADVTTGCVVRMELAKKKNAQDGMDQLFQRLGGLDGVMAMIDRLYECVERDKRINMFFEGAKLQSIKRQQTDYIIATLGGPADYRGRTLEDIHLVLQMNDYHLDCFMQNMGRALRDVGAEQDAVDEATVVLEQLRKQILFHHYKNSR
eukprot:CAMPEP_0204315914 /NCGR_PEP_ID=MMETSP0469-20131031/5104_1 /ASSEMBLY_ACC=CAM_ASM_000384 /TAXON_ID=2969 /ORGANISM="Oxyrrhis marina" /LENGTH=1158 /DNA_ID=CAMNT_0051296633 /DNA_START=50 /DNA_END=3526 /DNA_ORIENTATION=+